MAGHCWLILSQTRCSFSSSSTQGRGLWLPPDPPPPLPLSMAGPSSLQCSTNGNSLLSLILQPQAPPCPTSPSHLGPSPACSLHQPLSEFPQLQQGQTPLVCARARGQHLSGHPEWDTHSALPLAGNFPLVLTQDFPALELS